MSATKWLDKKAQAKLKRELIIILRTSPRERWVSQIMSGYSADPALRVAVFQIFCAMEQSGELDALKQARGRR